MYTAHFGLSEAPFSITPDPRYLYMSERHREALAHLLYGIGEGGGFVQLTGEIGTGKTTLCRCLLEQLPPEVDVALILNPKLTALELLATICDELGISYPAGATSPKVLVDALYRYLLEAHGRGRRTVLIIDEAQNLASEVLEQVRLLTNLETARRKLLQIILIGQPELILLLERPELRQLAQRVTARYHLLPFSEEDTRACIHYRMTVAGQSESIFSVTAMREVHRLSGGVPRLVNIICDRALLGAYAQDRSGVDAATVRAAAAEVMGRKPRRRYTRPLAWLSTVAVAAAAITGGWILFTPERLERISASLRPDRVEPSTPAAEASLLGREPAAPPSGPAVERGETPGPTLGDLLSDPGSDRTSAFASLYARWGMRFDPAKGGLGCERGRADGLACLFKTGTWNKLRRFNLPAIIELVTPAGEKRYATVIALGADSVTLAIGPQETRLPLIEVERFWDGPFILLWKPPALRTTILTPGMRGRDVEWLRRRLAEIDGRPAAGPNRDLYDDDLKEQVTAFQRRRALVPDGVAGEETLSHLITAVRDPGVPVLSSTNP
jgi:general secretion pathway protein A